MGKLVELEYNGGTIFVESTEIGYEGGLTPAGAVEAAEKNLEKLLMIVKIFCDSLKKNMDYLGNNAPDSYMAELGLSFAGEGNIFVAKISAEASIKVTANWGK